MSFRIAKASVVVCSAAIAFGVLHARAQPAGSVAQPSAAPSYVSGLPVSPPAGVSAEQWTALRRICQTIANKMAANQSLTTSEASARGLCVKYSYLTREEPPGAPPMVPEVPGTNVAPPPATPSA